MNRKNISIFLVFSLVLSLLTGVSFDTKRAKAETIAISLDTEYTGTVSDSLSGDPVTQTYAFSVLAKGELTVEFQVTAFGGAYSGETPDLRYDVVDSNGNSCANNNFNNYVQDLDVHRITVPVEAGDYTIRFSEGPINGLADIADYRFILSFAENPESSDEPVVTETPSPTPTATPKPIREMDLLNFENHESYLTEHNSKEEGFIILRNDFNTLTDKLDYTLKTLYAEWDEDAHKLVSNGTYNIKEESDDDNTCIPWDGSCYGMSALVFLVNSGLLSVAKLSNNKRSSLNETDSEELVSLVNFYQNQQMIYEHDMREEFGTLPQKKTDE